MSFVLYPAFKTFSTASSIAFASSSNLKLYLSIIATDNIVAIGFTIFWHAISGALPWIGSYIPKSSSLTDADGNIPIEPVIIDASSDIISPNMLLVTITSNWEGSFINCIATLSTYIYDNSTSGYSFDNSFKIFLHNLELSRTLALSTQVNFLFLIIAVSKAFLPILLISFSSYFSTSYANSMQSSIPVFLSPK